MQQEQEINRHLAPSWSFLPVQIQTLDAINKYNFVLYSGAYGAGKTLLLAHAAIRACLNYSGVKGIVASLTYTQLKNVVFTVFREELYKYQDLLNKNGIPVTLVKHMASSHGKMQIEFYNGSIVYFLSAEKEEKLRGYTIDFFCLDEPIDIDEEIFTQLLGRLRGKALPKPFALLTTNPGAETHWIYQRFYQKPEPNYFHVETTTYDNIFLPPEYIKNMEKAYDEDWVRRFLHGKWGAYEGQIYKRFNRNKHIVEDIERDYKYIIAGVDFGVRNPSVILTIGIDADNNAYVIDEYYKPTTSVQLTKILDELHKKYQYKRIYADPSALDLISQCKRIGLPIMKADNDIKSGIAKVKSLLQKDKMFVSRVCRNTIRELESYRYKRDRTGKNPEEQPVAYDDHTCFDKETEVLTDSGWKYFRDITFKDKLATLSLDWNLEYQYPSNIISYEASEIWSTKYFAVTPNHNILYSCQYQAKRGTKRLDRTPLNQIKTKSFWIPKKCNPITRDTIYEDVDAYTLGFYLAEGCKSITRIPREFMRTASYEQLYDCFLGMIDGDGSVSKNGQITYNTTSSKLADDFQELLLLLGMNGTKYISRHDGCLSKIRGREITSPRTCYRIIVFKDKSDYHCINKMYINKEKYNDKVYCATVPNGTLCVRRNGRIIFSGNCDALRYALISLNLFGISTSFGWIPKKLFSIDDM